MKNFVLVICGACLLAMAAPLAHADTIGTTYTFTGMGPTGFPPLSTINFTYFTPTPITSTTTVMPSGCTITTGSKVKPCVSIKFVVVGSDDDLVVNFKGGGLLIFEFAPNVFSIDGVHPTEGARNPGVLTVDIDTVAQIPEPASMALLGTGLLGVVALVRRRFNSGA